MLVLLAACVDLCGKPDRDVVHEDIKLFGHGDYPSLLFKRETGTRYAINFLL